MTQTVKNPPAMQETQVQSLSWEEPLEKGMATHLVFLPGESHGQRSLAGYSPWGHKESDTTAIITHNSAKFHFLPVKNPSVFFKKTKTEPLEICYFVFLSGLI